MRMNGGRLCQPVRYRIGANVYGQPPKDMRIVKVLGAVKFASVNIECEGNDKS